MSDDTISKMTRLVNSIKSRKSAVDNEAKRLRTPEILESFDRRSHRSWCISAVGDSLARIRLFIEQNFNFIETMGAVSVARYLFELSVWIGLFDQDSRYGLVYYSQLLKTQKRYYQDYKKQIIREISLLRSFEHKEKEAQATILQKLSPGSDNSGIGMKMRAIGKFIDQEAARHFSLYADQAKANGYGFQAHLVEREALARVEQALSAIENGQKEFDSDSLDEVKDLNPKRWEWRKMSEKVGLTDEYDFLYAFASKLLHATPASITTDQKNLEPEEFVLFLKYIDVKIADVVERAKRYP